jgi:hypothetical protein
MVFRLVAISLRQVLRLLLFGCRSSRSKDLELVGAENIIRRTDQGRCTRKNVGTCRATYVP